MDEAKPGTGAPARSDPAIRRIGARDIAEALAAGLRDFQAKPVIGLAFGAFFALGGMAMVLFVTRLEMTYFAYPLAAGFALIGPFIAIGLYEVSRRIESNQPIGFTSILRTAWGRSEIGWMAFVVLFIFIMWMYQVRLLMALLLGYNTNFGSIGQFLATITTTWEGFLFLSIGNVVGAVLSALLFSLTVVSFPILLDRDIDFITAMITSIRSVAANPVPMLGWAFVIVMVLIVSVLPLFLGLIITLPVLGHTTWHLYRRVVEPEASQSGNPT
jgi:uncharacterized membrane protein